MYSQPVYKLSQFKPLHLVHGPDHTNGDRNIDLAASVSSLCLEEVPSAVGPSTTILGAWSTMRKASAPFIVGNEVADNSFEF